MTRQLFVNVSLPVSVEVPDTCACGSTDYVELGVAESQASSMGGVVGEAGFPSGTAQRPETIGCRACGAVLATVARTLTAREESELRWALGLG